jgi:hypothetical protein
MVKPWQQFECRSIWSTNRPSFRVAGLGWAEQRWCSPPCSLDVVLCNLDVAGLDHLEVCTDQLFEGDSALATAILTLSRRSVHKKAQLLLIFGQKSPRRLSSAGERGVGWVRPARKHRGSRSTRRWSDPAYILGRATWSSKMGKNAPALEQCRGVSREDGKTGAKALAGPAYWLAGFTHPTRKSRSYALGAGSEPNKTMVVG